MFGVELVQGNAVDELFPGYPGWVIGQNHMKAMHWGFPFSARGKSGQVLKPRPVNNTRCDKLTAGFWRDSFAARRCLVPMTAFAEAEGEAGRKTRTWFSLPGGDLFVSAGLWRNSDQWGPVYSLVVTDASDQCAQIHDRMPVILAPEHYRRWLAGSPDEALELCKPFDETLCVERSSEAWTTGVSVKTA